MNMTCCGNSAHVITGTTQTNASPWALPPIALETKPLKPVNVLVMDAIVVSPAQEAALVIIMTADIAIAASCLWLLRPKLPCQATCSHSRSHSRSHSCGSRHSPCDHRLYIYGDIKWEWGGDCNLSHNSSPKKKHSTSPPWAKSLPVQVPATLVASKSSTNTKDHNDAPMPEFAAPKTIQWALYAEYPTPLSSPDYYTGDCWDDNDDLDSEGWQPKSTPPLYKDDCDSYGFYCPNGKKSSGMRNSSGDLNVIQSDYHIGKYLIFKLTSKDNIPSLSAPTLIPMLDKRLTRNNIVFSSKTKLSAITGVNPLPGALLFHQQKGEWSGPSLSEGFVPLITRVL